jgi:hypothetical protein
MAKLGSFPPLTRVHVLIDVVIYSFLVGFFCNISLPSNIRVIIKHLNYHGHTQQTTQGLFCSVLCSLEC